MDVLDVVLQRFVQKLWPRYRQVETQFLEHHTDKSRLRMLLSEFVKD